MHAVYAVRAHVYRFDVYPSDSWIQEVLSSTHDRLHTFSCWALPDLLVGLVQLGARPHYTWWDT